MELKAILKGLIQWFQGSALPQSGLNINDRMGIRATMRLALFTVWNEDGTRFRDEKGRFSRRLKETRIVENTVTELGDAHVADRIAGTGHAVIGWMSIGDGTGQVAADTGLDSIVDRNALTSITQGGGAADNDVVFVGTWAAGDGTGAITEAGIFRLNDDATMQYVASFAVINKLAADSLVITWTVQYGAS